MLKNLRRHKLQIAAIVILVLCLAAIRAFEDNLFYDPFLHYFKSDFTARPLPDIDVFKLSVHLFMRFSMNTLLSLGIIYAVFKNRDLVLFASVLYTLFFIILILLFYSMIAFDAEDKMVLFYVRRFLIQPLFLLLFIPAFYFQEKVSRKNNVS
jgi:exosortase F-associated protein